MNRRYFLMTSAALTGAAMSGRGFASPNDAVRVACVGVRGQGRTHIRAYSKMPNVQIAALCDVDESVLEEQSKAVEKLTGKRPAGYVDIRKLLDDKSIDAISIATPNHSHALQATWSCQAGKDVYVEKPCTHNDFEARQLVAAAKKYNRIVQHGTNGRSSSDLQEAVHHVREGLLGEVYMARGLSFKWRDTIGRAPEEPLPAGVHYDLSLGPAPQHPFTKNRFHYNFHWFWDYGNGDIGNQGVHQVDQCRWLLDVQYPTKVSSMGGHFMFDDDQETPNTQVATFEFDVAGKKKMLVFEVRHWISNHEAGIGERERGAVAAAATAPSPGAPLRGVKGARQSAPDAPGDLNTVGVIVYGSKGYLSTANRFKTFLGKEQQRGPGPSTPADSGDNWVNFIQAVRSRKHADLNAPVEEGAISVTLIHLANISHRLGRTLYFDSNTLTCKGDPEANQMLTRLYRKPFVVPEEV